MAKDLGNLLAWVGRYSRCLGTKEERVLILVPKALKPLKRTKVD